MPVIYNQATINARLQAVLTQISTGALQILDGFGSLLVGMPITILSVSSGVLILNAQTTVIARSGTAVSAQITGLSGVPVSGLTVSSGAGTDVVIGSAAMVAGNNAVLTSGSITGR